MLFQQRRDAVQQAAAAGQGDAVGVDVADQLRRGLFDDLLAPPL